ncbi:D-alanyl-D-alanine carboxypeptidase family protein [Streptomyces sp. NPDC088757]|uniref:D-alanyl-D-alanine carboxypeptidase family protein n=1 Tax=Streptomyces sp. NPDC088757 TaxID=3365889 RepID=UPI003801CF77
MAGESPDRAEQQGSSRETTAAASGGGGRDPRLSVLRESEPSAPSTSEEAAEAAEASEASDAPVRVDQPTAVFKTLTPRTSGDDAPKGDAEPESSPSEPEPESERLKAAVAAWVATAADDEPKEPVKTAEEASEPVEEPAETEEEAPELAEAGDGADAEPEAEDEAEAEDEDEDEDEAADGVAAESADAAGDSSDSEDGAPVEGKAPADSWFAARKSAAGAKTGAVKDPEPAGDAAEDAGDSEDVEDADEKPVDEKPVDQPTAMFKMIRPPVDQPTTALKLPAGSVDTDTDTDTDTDSERTSTFLPLRPDIPAERKAPAVEAVPKAPKASTTPEAPKVPKTSEAEAPEAPAAPVPAALAEPERTRQQPLPPLPPLDLLAELTNTPPPPPSPMRTTLRRIRIWTPLVLLLLIVFAIAQMVRPLPAPALKLSVAPTFAFEGGELKMPWPGEGQGAVEVEGVGSMGAYGPQKPAPIASVTKTMTAYVILRDHPLKGKQTGPEIEIDKKAADQGKAAHESKAPVQEGQTFSQKELLQLLMIPSANNVARLLARWDAGSEAAFVEKMNAAADELGMTQSTYTDPSGLLDSTVSTPKDQLKLAEAVMQYDVFREIVNLPEVTIDGIPGTIYNNNNILLKPGVGGIKTGSSTPAGGNLLWSANTIVDGQNRRILGIVMGAKNAKILDDKLQLSIDYSYELIKRAQKDVTSAAVVRKGQVVGYVDDGLGGKTPVVATKELKAVGWPGLQVKLELADGGKAVPHTGRAGDVVGQVSIGTGAGRVSSPVALQADLAEPGFDKKLTRVG